MTKPFHGTGRVVIADSWFGSVKSALALLTVGLVVLRAALRRAFQDGPSAGPNCFRSRMGPGPGRGDLEGRSTAGRAGRSGRQSATPHHSTHALH